MRLISGRVKYWIYRAQCLFFGDVSWSALVVTIKVARKIRWHVHGMPLAIGAKRVRKRSSKTSAPSSVPDVAPERRATYFTKYDNGGIWI